MAVGCCVIVTDCTFTCTLYLLDSPLPLGWLSTPLLTTYNSCYPGSCTGTVYSVGCVRTWYKYHTLHRKEEGIFIFCGHRRWEERIKQCTRHCSTVLHITTFITIKRVLISFISTHSLCNFVCPFILRQIKSTIPSTIINFISNGHLTTS